MEGDLVYLVRGAVRLALQRGQIDHRAAQLVEPLPFGDDAGTDLVDEASYVAALQRKFAAAVANTSQGMIGFRLFSVHEVMMSAVCCNAR